ncbi:MAG: selenocysteine-specific translation elongation factor, partial [Deltaproteobacteria bacterium]|nr:selenocysteine-specific translation elongation factor [Deltaproteobacteria bacterium]
IIGTAGHIDHGKTSLIKALTGQETDRLKEEQERGISIDLGFAYLDLPDGERAGIVDVPGHERFIRNMLAGAHGIDLVLFTVAADDGVMPQSEEHLDFLHLLSVKKGIFVITKADLVEPARVAEVQEEIEILTLDTTLEGAPIIPVSSVTGLGLDRLRQEIAAQLQAYERPPLPGYFRLPVDRAFVMKGHGVVVTGTAVAGTVREGETVRVLPGGEETRVRSLQVHGQPVSSAKWGQRVALNLAGLEKSDITRGHVVCHPKVTLTTQRFDAFVEIRPGARREIENHERVRVHMGTAEAIGKIIILDGREVLPPRSTAFCQIVLEEPLVALRGDRFILRNQTAQGTLGGGEVLHPFAQRHRRSEEGVGERLAALRTADLLQACRAYLEAQSDFAAPLEEIYQGVNAREDEVAALLAQDPEILPFPDKNHPEAYSVASKWRRLTAEVGKILAAFHRSAPLARGMEMESLRSQLPFSFSPKIFRAVADKLIAEGVAVREESTLRLPAHSVTLNEDEQGAAARLERLLQEGGFTPPEVKELEEKLRTPRKLLTELLSVLESRGKVVKVTTDLYFSAAVLEKAKTALTAHLTAQGEITAATFRDLLGISRKTAIPLLEYFDRTGLTLRVGDVRKLRKK